MTDSVLSVLCPTCRQSVIWNETSPFRPFCSKRCQLIDLGEWANESHKIASEVPLDEEDLEQIIEHFNLEVEHENFKY